MLTRIDDIVSYNGFGDSYRELCLFHTLPKKLMNIDDDFIKDGLFFLHPFHIILPNIEEYFERMDIYLNAKYNYFKFKAEFEC